jgi:predicted TIM-barrel fold metal-dependent hydrolase/ketosteroid isomerase-like protein
MTGEVHVPTAVIDADGHVVEPPAAWDALPDSHRPTIHRDDHGFEHVTVGDKEILAVPLGTLATPGADFADAARYTPLAEAQPGGSDPVARLADMDAEGIDQAVLYPSIGLYFWALTDPAAATAVATAYNDWLSGYCAADPTRLFGAAMLPMQDPDQAVREFRRAVEELGFKAAFARPNPCMGRSLSDHAYQPVWRVAEELGVPVGIHEGSSVIVPTLGADRPFNPLILHAVSHSFEEMLACAQLVALGTLEHHPDLRIVFLESGGGWVPFWLERLDEQAETFGGFCPDMRLRPSEYFARQCAVSFEVDESTLPALLPFIGDERVVWGSDYPHHDATFPGAVVALRRTMGPIGVDSQARILGANARRIYGLPSRWTGATAVVVDYFAAVTMRDTDALTRLFAADATVVAEGTRHQGTETIARFYREGAFHFEDLLPHPRSFRVEGNRVVVELDLHIAGTSSTVVDTFEIVDGRIRSLVIQGLSDQVQSRLAELTGDKRFR